MHQTFVIISKQFFQWTFKLDATCLQYIIVVLTVRPARGLQLTLNPAPAARPVLCFVCSRDQSPWSTYSLICTSHEREIMFSNRYIVIERSDHILDPGKSVNEPSTDYNSSLPFELDVHQRKSIPHAFGRERRSVVEMSSPAKVCYVLICCY